METELILSIGGFPPLSARGCVQELSLLQQGHLRRTINGELIQLGRSNNKYKSIIYCSDKTSLATEGLNTGITIRVGCIQRLWQKILPEPENAEIVLERYPIAHSLVVIDEEKQDVPLKNVTEKNIKLFSREKLYFLSYRPWLEMKVISYTLHTNEWGLKTSWRLELEEV